MPDFLFQWLKLIIYYLNLFLGNIGLVRLLKRYTDEAGDTAVLFYMIPVAFVVAVAIVMVLLVITRFFKKEPKGVVRVAARR